MPALQLQLARCSTLPARPGAARSASHLPGRAPLGCSSARAHTGPVRPFRSSQPSAAGCRGRTPGPHREALARDDQVAQLRQVAQRSGQRARQLLPLRRQDGRQQQAVHARLGGVRDHPLASRREQEVLRQTRVRSEVSAGKTGSARQLCSSAPAGLDRARACTLGGLQACPSHLGTLPAGHCSWAGRGPWPAAAAEGAAGVPGCSRSPHPASVRCRGLTTESSC